VGTGKPFTLELNTAASNPDLWDSDFWTEIAVFQGPCGSFICIVQDEKQGANAAVNVTVPFTTVGAQYKVLVAAWKFLSYDVLFQFTATEES
jgi:hypothetical protein